MTTDPLKIAHLEPAFFLHLEVEEPTPIYSSSAEQLTLVKIKNGYTKTLDPKYPFDTELTFGFDNLRVSTATPNTTTLDCQLILKSKANGLGIQFVYSGVIHGNESITKVLQNKAKSHDYTDGYVTNHPKAFIDKNAKEEAWILNKNLIGKGHFIRDEEGTLGVEYYIYVLE